MKIKLKNHIRVLMSDRGVKSWSDLAERLKSNQGYDITRTSISRQAQQDNPAYAMDLIEAICNELQCLPDALFNIEITEADSKELDRLRSRLQPFEYGSIHLAPPKSASPASSEEASGQTGPAPAAAPRKAPADPRLEKLLGPKVTHMSAAKLKKK